MMIIRNAIFDDLNAIRRILCNCYEKFEQTDQWPNDVIMKIKKSRGSVEHIRTLMANENLFVAVGDHVKGMVSVHENEVTKLYVSPQYQGNGIGKLLFIHAESFIKKRGFKKMFLGASVQTPIPFYERMGMYIDCKRKIVCGPCKGMTSVIFEKTLAK